jgi:hypothetical protein
VKSNILLLLVVVLAVLEFLGLFGDRAGEAAKFYLAQRQFHLNLLV